MRYHGERDFNRRDEPKRRGDARGRSGVGAPKPHRDDKGRFVGSGNPNGRPRKRPSTLLSGILDALNAPVSLGDGSSGKKISMPDALGMKIRKDLLKGTPRETIAMMAALRLLGVWDAQERAAEQFDEDTDIFTEEHRRILANLRREIDEAEENDGDEHD